MPEINNFDVLKEMGERNLDIRAAPLSNMIAANLRKDHGEIVMGTDTQTVMDILNNKPLLGMLIICDKEQFDKVKSELESQ